jgi:hypothetical protein
MANINLAELFPYEERKAVLRKANIIFKKDMDMVLKVWQRFADPLRGTLVKAYNKYIMISHTEPDVIHVSDIVRLLIYNEANDAIVTDEKKIRILARGILYHYLFRRRFGGRVKAVFEFPITWYVDPFTVVGNVDVILPDGDEYYIVELKSSNTETTINFGVVQVKIYWLILKEVYNLNVAGAFVSTPKQDIEVDNPITKRELKKLVKIYAKLTGKISEANTTLQSSPF